RDASEGSVTDRDLPEPINRRARHVISENARVIEAVAALRVGDARAFGALMNASHASMRDDFDVSTPEVDALVEIARHEPGVFGARLTGGGFGGSIVALAQADDAAAAAVRIGDAYPRPANIRPTILVPLL